MLRYKQENPDFKFYSDVRLVIDAKASSGNLGLSKAAIKLIATDTGLALQKVTKNSVKSFHIRCSIEAALVSLHKTGNNIISAKPARIWAGKRGQAGRKELLCEKRAFLYVHYKQ